VILEATPFNLKLGEIFFKLGARSALNREFAAQLLKAGLSVPDLRLEFASNRSLGEALGTQVQGYILRTRPLCKKNSGSRTGCNEQQRASTPENKRSACAL
jgi:hypothetical protein